MVTQELSLKQFFLQRVIDCSEQTIQFSVRYHAAAKDITRRISLSLSKASGKSVKIVWPQPIRAGADWGNKFPAVQISFRVFGQRLKLYLPVEVVTELCDGLLQSNSNFILSELSEKDSIAIGYLAGLVLNDSSAFPKQRAYLQAVDIVEAISLPDLQDHSFVALPIVVGGSDSTILLSFENRLQQIFLENAARLAVLTTRRAWFESLCLHGSVTAKIVIDDLHALLALKPGMRLAVSVSEARLELSQQDSQFFHNSSIALTHSNRPDTERFQLYL